MVDDGVRILGLAVEVPAQALASALPTRALPTFGGTISIASTQFAWNANESSGTLDARWAGARLVSGDAVADLGTVALALTPQDGRFRGRLTNSGGDVKTASNSMKWRRPSSRSATSPMDSIPCPVSTR